MSRRDVDEALEGLLAEGPSFAVRELGARTGFSRQALQRHLVRWIDEGRLERTGAGRSVRYQRAGAWRAAGSYSHRSARPDDSAHGGASLVREHPTDGLEESEVWRELRTHLDELAAGRTPGADSILAYAACELVNNAIDHSGAPSVRVRAEVRGHTAILHVEDAGIGAFESVRLRLHLADALEALGEVSKGKVTTQPDRHAGEGLFFTSKAVDAFELHANGLVWVVERGDQAVLEEPVRPGTTVVVRVDLRTHRSMEELFAAYTTDLAFDRSRAVVKLFEHGTRFVSRSEAKRLARGLERFREVLVDFTGVEGVGQGFVDELFRVWARAYPGTHLEPVHMNRPVEFMVRRGLAGEGSRERRPGAGDQG